MFLIVLLANEDLWNENIMILSFVLELAMRYISAILLNMKYFVERKVMPFFLCAILKSIVVQLRRLSTLTVGIILKHCSYCYCFHFILFFYFYFYR